MFSKHSRYSIFSAKPSLYYSCLCINGINLRYLNLFTADLKPGEKPEGVAHLGRGLHRALTDVQKTDRKRSVAE